MFDEEITGAFPKGKKTKQELEEKGIFSPELKRMVKIGKGIWLSLPDEINSEEEKQKWIKIKKLLYNIKNDY
jgi:hypothetical protein